MGQIIQPGNMPSVSLKDSTPVKCEECGCEVFQQGIKLRKISKLLTGGSKDTITGVPVIACIKCGHVNKDLEPQFDEIIQ